VFYNLADVLRLYSLLVLHLFGSGMLVQLGSVLWIFRVEKVFTAGRRLEDSNPDFLCSSLLFVYLFFFIFFFVVPF